MKKQLLSILSILAVGVAVAQPGIPNAGFESWGANFGAPTEPTNYVTENVFASPFISSANPTSVTQATGADLYAGTYSAKVTTVRITTNPSGGAIPDTVGVMIFGSITLAPAFALKPGKAWTTGRLTSVDFYYKYAPVNGDNGAVAAYMTKWNTVTSSRDTLSTAFMAMTTTVSAYTLASVPFVDNPNVSTAIQPDSLHLYFLSSARPWISPTLTPVSPKVGSALWVDGATAVGLKGSTKLFTNDVKVYPNPATNYFNISSANEQASYVEVYDITGNKIATGNFEDKKVRIETSNFAEGLYLYSVKDKDKKVIASGKVNVSK